METLSRKQREIREREKKILSLARPIVVHEGYQALSMDGLATKMEYAKGTLYNHFPNKEDIVAALAVESLELRLQLFDAASGLSPHSHERIMAIGAASENYAIHCPEHFAVEQLLRNSVIWQKSSEKRHDLIRQCEWRCMSIVSGIVRDAVASSDLEIPDGMSAEELVFGFWSLIYGSHLLIASSPSLPDIGISNPVRSIRFHAWTLMNGYNWKPQVSFDDMDVRMSTFAQRLLSDARD